MYYNMADTIMQFDGTQMYAGAKAAEKEINAGGTIDGVQLEVVYVPAASYCACCACWPCCVSLLPQLFSA
ncbi:Hypothetical protein, putative [Bodo saltans]|uniref:Uncharacterized protein n=1 Tax=Bodo saltans TaxID=75058 RepID=A0A0S4J5U9_BODSA|nr:Hypothetical protein, putative [Bodo saltans]|eukprot:CUG61428.1 Hypothetical protein, putative [Bodo saltans]